MNFRAIDDSVMLIQTKRESFDMRRIVNRRFMFCPETGELILGKEGVVSAKDIEGSHALEHMESGTKTPYDEFVRGWVGGPYESHSGIVHFAPAIKADNCEDFERAWRVLDAFLQNYADGKTIVRGFGSTWEQPINRVLFD